MSGSSEQQAAAESLLENSEKGGTSNSRTLVSIPFVGELNEGFTRANMITFFYSSMASVGALVFLNGALPFLLTNILKVPQDQQGDHTGTVLLWNEITVILSIACIGLVSDRIGRKIVYAAGFLLMGSSIFIHPFATNFVALVLVRVLFAFGASASVSMLTAILGDYPTNKSRGRAGGIMGLMSGAGALTALFIFLRIPTWINFRGPKGSGELMFWIVGAWLLLSAIFLWYGLSDRINPENKHASILSVVVDGLKATKNPRILLAYLASFAARGDSIVLTSFLSLWVNKYEIAHGKTPAEAIAHAGVVSGIAQTCALVFAIPFGFLADRVDRVLALLIAAVTACIGYFMLFIIPSPDGALVYIAVCIVGLGEIGMIVGGQVLIAAEAPQISRGAVSGFFGLMGSLSILITTKLGGYLFDNWMETSPFLVVGGFNAIVFIFAIIVWIINCYTGRQNNHNNNGHQHNGESYSKV